MFLLLLLIHSIYLAHTFLQKEHAVVLGATYIHLSIFLPLMPFIFFSQAAVLTSHTAVLEKLLTAVLYDDNVNNYFYCDGYFLDFVEKIMFLSLLEN